MEPNVPKAIQPIIYEYAVLVNTQLRGLINSFYLVGSVALGEFNEKYSDIDFVTVLSRIATLEEIEKIGNVHKTIEQNHCRWKMSGSYIQLHDLGKVGCDIEPHPHFHDSVLKPNAYHDLNLVTWWELKNHGISVIGGNLQDLFVIDWDLLLSKMKQNLNSYWVSWTNHPKRVALLFSDWGIQWAVLSVLRQFYTFNENTITTKVKAGEYALKHLPTRWHHLIGEAINIRKDQRGSAYHSRLVRTIDGVSFLKYLIRFCNTRFDIG